VKGKRKTLIVRFGNTNLDNELRDMIDKLIEYGIENGLTFKRCLYEAIKFYLENKSVKEVSHGETQN